MKSSEIRRLSGKFLNITVFLCAMSILIATSESDLPSADSEAVSVDLSKEETKATFLLSYSKGPFNFDSLPLMLEIEISHTELNENFDYDQQSWSLVTTSVDGGQPYQRVLFRRGNDDILRADRGKYTLEGRTSLFQCAPMSDDACIPCEMSQERCQLKVELVREGAPYPAETVTMSASQWLLDESSNVQLALSAGDAE